MTSPPSAECRELLASVLAYLEGTLDAPTGEIIEAHCRNCARCASVIAGLRETVGLCRQAGNAPLPESIRARARAGVRRLLDDH